MGTSTLGHYTRFDEAFIEGNEPVDTGVAWRAINNLNHLADQYAQHRVNWVAEASGAGLEVVGTLTAGPRFWIWRSGLFDLHVSEDGESYPLVGWLRVHSGHAERQAVFYAALVPVGGGTETPEVELAEGGSNVSTCVRTSDAFAWEPLLAPLTLGGEKLVRARAAIGTRDAVSGPSVVAAIIRARVHVYASINFAGGAPRLGGARFVEFRS